MSTTRTGLQYSHRGVDIYSTTTKRPLYRTYTASVFWTMYTGSRSRYNFWRLSQVPECVHNLRRVLRRGDYGSTLGGMDSARPFVVAFSFWGSCGVEVPMPVRTTFVAASLLPCIAGERNDILGRRGADKHLRRWREEIL